MMPGAVTTNEYLSSIIRANAYYRSTGVAMHPWELDRAVPEDWVEAVLQFDRLINPRKKV
jgi:hypothetical protein